MSPKTFDLCGVTVTADFDDRALLRDILETYEDVLKLREEADGQMATIPAARLTLDVVDRVDAILVRAIGQEARDAICGADRQPVLMPVKAFLGLVQPAGEAYDAMFADI